MLQKAAGNEEAKCPESLVVCQDVSAKLAKASAEEGRSLFEVLECPSRRNQHGNSNGPGATVVNWPEVRDLGLYWASVDHGYWGADATGSVSIGSSSWELFERLHETVLSSDLGGLGAELGLSRDNQRVAGERCSRWSSSLVRVVSAVWREWSLCQESDAKEAIARLKVLAELLRGQGKDIGQLEELCRVAAERVGSDDSDDGRGIGPMGFLTKDEPIPDSWSDIEETPDEPVPADKVLMLSPLEVIPILLFALRNLVLLTPGLIEVLDDCGPDEDSDDEEVGEVWEDDGVFWDEGQQVWDATPRDGAEELAEIDPLRGFKYQDVPEGNGVCGREGSAEVVEDPGVAYLLPPEDAEAIVSETFFLSRVATQERYALLEEIRLSDPSSLPSVDSLASLEMRISRLQAELELSRAAESFQEISTVHSDSVRMSTCRLAAAVASGPVPADVQNEGVQEDIMFQTRTVDPQEANSQIQRWIAPLTEEYIGLTSQYRAILPVDVSEVDETSGDTEACHSEPSLWKILDQHNNLHGLLGAYVDDFLLTALQNVLDSALAVIRSKWEVSEPKQVGVHDVHFLGVDLHLAGNVYYMSQVGYVVELLKRHPEVSGVAWAPFPSTKEEDTCDMLRSEEAPNLALVRKAQGLLGELTWLATKTRIDIAWSTNKASQLTARHPEQAIEICHNIIRYLRQYPDLAISFGPHDDLGVLQVYADAAFAPGGARSQSGALVLWSGGLIGWFTSRQSFITLSTAESELYASIEGMVLHDSIRPLLEELVDLQVPTLYSDNVANVAIISVPAGEVMIADVLTKAMPPLRMTKLLQLANVVQLPSEALRALILLAVCRQVRAQPDRVEDDDGAWWPLLLLISVVLVLAKLLEYLFRALWARGGLEVNGQADAYRQGSAVQVFAFADDLAIVGSSEDARAFISERGLRRRSASSGSVEWVSQGVSRRSGLSENASTAAFSAAGRVGAEVASRPWDYEDYAERAFSPDPYAFSGSDRASETESDTPLIEALLSPRVAVLTSSSSNQVSAEAPVAVSRQALVPNTLDPSGWLSWDARRNLGHRLRVRGRDYFEYLPEEAVLIRWHASSRRQFFDPRASRLPVPLSQLVGWRVTYCTFHNGEERIYQDHFTTTPRGRGPDEMQWRGRTEFLVYQRFDPRAAVHPSSSVGSSSDGLPKAAPLQKAPPVPKATVPKANGAAAPKGPPVKAPPSKARARR
ncbi:TY4B-H [Symbiodinium sp. CCMP2592]|nr:TY4B-H [Symbiodinium sp. CCMP2592]